MENRGAGACAAAMMRADIQGTLRAFSHDLRTPLENVIALVTLSLDKLSEETRDGATAVIPYLRRALSAVHDMEMLTNDLLAEDQPSGAMERFTAHDLAESVSMAIEERAEKKRQLLHIDVNGLGGETMTGDVVALRRILINLMSNAVKYTQEEGRISLTARRNQLGCGVMEAEFIVEDNGMGMDAAFMQHMYEPLVRSDQALADAIPGHGLGLTIVRRMTQRMNGTITAESEPGCGTRFVLRVPLAACDDVDFGTEESLEGKRFLLAEDNDLSAEIAASLLSEKGAHVRRASDGRQAAELFASLPVGTFDAILMDMHMPWLDGCAAAAQIRCMRRTDAGSIPIFALTAGGDMQDERAARAAGMNGCLKKPLDTAFLSAVMRRDD